MEKESKVSEGGKNSRKGAKAVSVRSRGREANKENVRYR